MFSIVIELSGFSAVQYLLWFLVLTWLVSLALTIFGLFRQKPLLPATDTRLQAADSPLVSVLVPARNEEHRVLADCIRSLLAQDYGRFEVIAVDDRSTDATGAILKSLARTDARLQVIDGKELPPGWLGKPNAMHTALEQARGEWILATDADMIFDQTLLRTAVAHAIDRQADAISLIPHFEALSFWERLMTPNWAWVMLMFAVSYRINDPRTPGALGIGGFILVRRPILELTGGFAALKDEVLDDVRLAERIKGAHGRMLTAHAPALLRTRMYRNFREMWECSTKSWFAGMKFSLPFAMLCVAWMYLMAVVPPLTALAAAAATVSGNANL